MGRVRRYKKFKACDPFSKQSRSTVSANEMNHDQPPEIHDDAVRKANQKRIAKFQDEDHFEKMMQREAMRAISAEEHKKPSEKMKSKLEGRKDGETLKQFKQRIRQTTRLALRDELRNLTSTGKKKKEYLITKKYKKKGIDRFDINEEIIEEGFSSRDDGALRQSDLGGEDGFQQAEVLKFGERMDMPPEFKGIDPLKRKNADGTKEIMNLSQKKNEKKRKIEHGSSKLKTAGLADTGASFQRDDDDDDDDDDYKSKKNIKIKKRKITDIVGESSGYEGNNEYRMADGYLVPVTGKKGARANDKDKNALRIQAQEAYRALRDSKRKF